MGVDFADIDAHGLLDIFVSNITESYALEESNFVFMNTGRSGDLAKGTAPFIDQSEARGLSRSGWSWDAKLDDFDNSGQLEVLQATGFVRGSVDRWPELQELAMANDQFLHEPRAWLRVMPGDDLSGQTQPVLRGRQGRILRQHRARVGTGARRQAGALRAALPSPTRSATEGWTSRSRTNGATRFFTGTFRLHRTVSSAYRCACRLRNRMACRRRKAVSTPSRPHGRRSELRPPLRCPMAGAAPRRWTAATAIPASARPSSILVWRHAGGRGHSGRLEMAGCGGRRAAGAPDLIAGLAHHHARR
jgi:hypothetical protein